MRFAGGGPWGFIREEVRTDHAEGMRSHQRRVAVTLASPGGSGRVTRVKRGEYRGKVCSYSSSNATVRLRSTVLYIQGAGGAIGVLRTGMSHTVSA